MAKATITVVRKKPSQTPTTDKQSTTDGAASDTNAQAKSVDKPPQKTDKLVKPPANKTQLLALFDVSALPIQTVNDATNNKLTADQRARLYQQQHERTRQLYLADANMRPTYLVQQLKPKFIEYEHYLMSANLDKRGVAQADAVKRLWQQLHVVDDMIDELIGRMPAQQPAGWQLTTQGRNHLRLPTVGRLRSPDVPVADQASLNSYVLGHFGVMSYSYDRSYYIGHVLGYLFCCYFCAHLSIAYGVTPLSPSLIKGYDYVSLETPKMVRLLQALDTHSKKRIYQLAVICARLSYYATDKRIEKMLIAEVNNFDKNEQQNDIDTLLAQGILPASGADNIWLDDETWLNDDDVPW